MASPEIHRLLARAFGKGDSKAFPAILEMMVGTPAAELLLSLPATPEGLSEKFSQPPDTIRAVLDRGFDQGLLVKREGEGGGIRYHLSGRIEETVLGDPRNDEAGHGILDLWREDFETHLAGLSGLKEHRYAARVLPVESVVGTTQTILPFERLREILERAHRRVVLDCMCRKRSRKCEMPIHNMCFWLDDAAEYFLGRGVGREVTVDRGLEILWQAEKLGLVHLTDILLFENSPAKVGWICNCCSCCCSYLRQIRRSRGTVGLLRSFRAEVNSLLCERCGLCAGRCYFGAFRFRNDGVPVIHPDRCVGCGLCAANCEHGAIRLVRIEDPGVPETTRRAIIHAVGE